MRVRKRVPAPTRAQRFAALRSCRHALAGFGACAALLALGVGLVLRYPLLIDGHSFHTRMPALLAAAVFALTVQAGAIGIDYRDRLVRQQRRQGRPAGDTLPGVVFDLPRQRTAEADVKAATKG